MTKEELPPLEFDGKFDGYGFFDPRVFWEKVTVKDHDRQTTGFAQRGGDMTKGSKRIGGESTPSEACGSKGT